MSSILDALKKLEAEKAEMRSDSVEPGADLDLAERDLLERNVLRDRVTIRLTPASLLATTIVIIVLLAGVSIGIAAIILAGRGEPAARVASQVSVEPPVPGEEQVAPSVMPPAPEAVQPESVDPEPAQPEASAVEPMPEPMPEPEPTPESPAPPMPPPAEPEPAAIREKPVEPTAPPEPPAQVAVAEPDLPPPAPPAEAPMVTPDPEPQPQPTPKAPEPQWQGPMIKTRPAPPREQVARSPESSEPVAVDMEEMMRHPLRESDRRRLGLTGLRVNMLQPANKKRPHASAIISLNQVFVGEVIPRTNAKLIAIDDLRGVVIEMQDTRERFYVRF